MKQQMKIKNPQIEVPEWWNEVRKKKSNYPSHYKPDPYIVTSRQITHTTNANQVFEQEEHLKP